MSEETESDRAWFRANKRLRYLTEEMLRLQVIEPGEFRAAAIAVLEDLEDYDEVGDKQPWTYLDDATTDRRGLLAFVEWQLTECFALSGSEDPVAYLAVATPGRLREDPNEYPWDWCYGNERRIREWQKNGYEVEATASPSPSRRSAKEDAV